MGAGQDVVALRRAVLAVAVLDDVDLTPGERGVNLPAGRTEVLVGWADVAAAVGPDAPESPVARLRVGTLLRAATRLGAGGTDDAWVARHVRALALPPGHVLHPGPEWVRDRVLGGVLDVGLGLVGLGPERPGPPGTGAADGTAAAQPLPPSLAGRRCARWWLLAAGHAGRMGTLAAARVARSSPGVLRPVGGCDVLTLLATRQLRAALATGDGSGLRAVAAPTRTRAWYDLRRVDPAYVAAVWAATDEPDRGVARPLLVTRDEVALPRTPVPR
jgi:hypothetical protein